MKAAPFYVFGNWKANKTVQEAAIWCQDLFIFTKKRPLPTNISTVLCPSFIHLTTVASFITLYRLPLKLGVQDLSSFSNGAYTGHTTAPMLKGLVNFAIIGHSERRKYDAETEVALFDKIARCREAGIEPVYCIQDADMEIPANCDFVAYEPVWAIGTGKAETPENADAVAKKIQERANRKITVIYGGSVTPENVASYTKMPHLRGVLPGGASLKPDSFAQLILNAR